MPHILYIYVQQKSESTLINFLLYYRIKIHDELEVLWVSECISLLFLGCSHEIIDRILLLKLILFLQILRKAVFFFWFVGEQYYILHMKFPLKISFPLSNFWSSLSLINFQLCWMCEDSLSLSLNHFSLWLACTY